MDFDVKGTVLPVLEARLQPGETVVSTHGDLGWMTPSVSLSQTTQMGSSGARGIMKAAKRVVGGAGLFLTRYTAESANGTIVFASKLPGNIINVEVTPERSYYVHRTGFLCGTEGIEASVAMQQKKLTGGFFGGMGFFLQHLTGEGVAWLELSGEMFTYDLPAGQTLRVHPGHVGAFDQSVTFTVGTIPGIANKFFGGNGFFLADLTGPGRIWLQSMSIAMLAAEIAEYLPDEDGGGSGKEKGSSGLVDGIIGGVFGN
jgi:uncharacterized protein (TIGR00266 family)